MRYVINRVQYNKRGYSAGKLLRWEGKPCPYCGIRMTRTQGWGRPCSPSRDHRIPLSRGGPNVPDNLLICCRRCNERKGSLDEEEFAAWKDGLASRLDHGWWSSVRKNRPELRSRPSAYYGQLHRRMAAELRAENASPLRTAS